MHSRLRLSYTSILKTTLSSWHKNLDLGLLKWWNDFKFDDTPKQLHITKAAARGAVIVLVIPAEKRPIAIKYFAKIPNIGSKPIARSPALLISKESIFEAVIIIHKETNPPMLIAIIKSLKAKGKSLFLDHFFLTNSAWRKRL